MAREKDYSIYNELDLSLTQIKRELPKVAAAANSRLAKLEKINARNQWEYGAAKEFFVSQGRERERFSKATRRSEASLRQEWEQLIAFMTAPETTVTGYKIAEMQRRFDKSQRTINGEVTESNYKQLYDFLSSRLYQKHLRKALDSNQIIDDIISKINDPDISEKEMWDEYKQFLDGYISKEELFDNERVKLK